MRVDGAILGRFSVISREFWGSFSAHKWQGATLEGAVGIHLKAGDAVIFNDHLLHGAAGSRFRPLFPVIFNIKMQKLPLFGVHFNDK